MTPAETREPGPLDLMAQLRAEGFERGRKIDAEQLELLREALWDRELGRDPSGDGLETAVRDLLLEIGGRP